MERRLGLILLMPCSRCESRRTPAAIEPTLTSVFDSLSGGWLSTVNSTNGLTSRPITVIGTGNTPLSLVESQVPRYIFYDAPLASLDNTYSNITSQISPVASTNFAREIGKIKMMVNDTQGEVMKRQISTAHNKGIKARYWDLPAWPINTRNTVWSNLILEEVDLLNVDDLEAGAGLINNNNW